MEIERTTLRSGVALLAKVWYCRGGKYSAYRHYLSISFLIWQWNFCIGLRPVIRDLFTEYDNIPLDEEDDGEESDGDGKGRRG